MNRWPKWLKRLMASCEKRRGCSCLNMAAELCLILWILALRCHGGELFDHELPWNAWQPLASKFDGALREHQVTPNASGIHFQQNEPNGLCATPGRSVEWKFPNETFDRTYESRIGTDYLDGNDSYLSWIGTNYKVNKVNEIFLGDWIRANHIENYLNEILTGDWIGASYIEGYVNEIFTGVNGWIGANYMLKYDIVVSYLMENFLGGWIGTNFIEKYVMVDFTWSWIGASMVRPTNGWIGSTYMHDDEMVKDMKCWIGTNYSMDCPKGKFMETRGETIYSLDFFDEEFESFRVMRFLAKGSTGWIGTSIGAMVWHIVENNTEKWFGAALVVLYMVWKKAKSSNINVNEYKYSHLSQSMKPYRKSRRWNGSLKAQWVEKFNLRGVVFISLLRAGHAMDQQQASRILDQMAELASSATRAATASTAALDAFQKNQEEYRSKPRAGDFTKILKQPDSFVEADPVKFMGWREQFINWISFIDKRYVELFAGAERLTTEVKMEDFTDESKELAQQLFSILGSYLRGPAGQLVRTHFTSRNGFRVWQELLKLYLPRTRPRTMALGQAIIQHPAFGNSKSMTESLLQLDQLLEQYEVASGFRFKDAR